MSQTKSGRLFSRKKQTTVRGRYLDYLQQDVKQRLAASIHAARFLDIGVNEKLNATAPWYYKAVEGKQQFSNFDLAFEHFQGRVLLLGPPGSGKTTTLLNLALKLIDEAQQNLAADIPLLFNLSKFGHVSPRRVSEQLKWLRRRKDPEENPARVFEEWLVQMLVEMPVEGLKRQVAQQWVSSGNIAPLLDGLDELNDTYVLKLGKILNQAYFREHPDQVVVVCSRIIEYQPLQNKEARLRLNGAVIVQPPTPEQIDEYLETAQALALRDALRIDNALYEMAQTPLTLSMMTLAYGGEAPTDIPADLPFIERRRILLDTYVERMIQRTARREKGIPFDLNADNDVPPRYLFKETNHYLGWLAIKLSERSKTLFPPARFYSFLANDYPPTDIRSIKLTYGVAMLAVWLVALLTNAGLLLPQGWSPVWALVVIPLLAPLVVLGAAAFQMPEEKHGCMELLLGYGCMQLLLLPPAVLLAIGYFGIFVILIIQSVVSVLGYRIDPEVITVGGVVISNFLLTVSVIVTIAFGILVLNEEVRGILLTVAAIVVIANLFGGPAVATLAVVGILLVHLISGTVAASRFLEWLILNPLLKLILVRTKSICFRYKAFLEYATDTLLLKEVGIEYEFVHRLVRDHFAVRELLPQLYQASGEQRLKIIERLSRQGDSSLDALASLITNSDPQVRIAVVASLGQIAMPKVALIMEEVLRTDPDEVVRVSVLENLQKIPEDDQQQIFKLAIKDSSPLVREAVIIAGRNAADILLQGLEDESQTVFRKTLIQIHFDNSFLLPKKSLTGNLRQRLEKALTDPLRVHSPPRQVLTSNLLERLANAVLDVEDMVSRGAAYALRGFYLPGAQDEFVAPGLSFDPIVPALVTRSTDKDSLVREAMIAALTAIASENMSVDHHEQIKEVLINASRDSSDEVRQEAISGLGKLASPETLRALRESLNRGDVPKEAGDQ